MQRYPMPTFPTSEVFEVVIPLLSHIIRVMLSSLLLVRVRVKTLRITRIPERRDDRASIFPEIGFLPIYAFEERVVLDALCAA